uniref:Reverse transcriptase domain-containing protein n=1 Tax=Tanacetum cinerariifolium TaxID=118510 RepID=A0A6L2NU32_TANCI|nr:reverse transcriptase domain-containing protein [Tanacetum cinerariifolium]
MRVVPKNYNPKGERFFSLRATVTSSSKLSCDQTSNPTSSMNPAPKGRIHRSFKQKVENSNFEEHLPPVATMTDNRTMVEMLHAPTEGYAEAILVPPVLAEQFELKHSLIKMMTSEQFFGLEKDNPHDHIRWGSPPVAKKEPPRSITTWDDLERYKDLLCACPHHGFTELHQLDTFYNALNPADQDSLNAAAGGNLLEKSPQDALTIIENKSKVRSSRSKMIASPVNACDIHSSSEIAKLTHAVNQQTSVVTTAMTAMLKQLQANLPPAQVKAVEEICVTCGGAHPYYQCLAADGNTFSEFTDNIQCYVSAAASNYNQGNPGYHPQGVANQIRPPGFAQPNVQNNQNRFGQPQGFNRGTNFNQEQPYQATAQSNQNFYLNELEKFKRINDVSMKAMQNQMNTASITGSGSLSGHTIANLKGELKAITTRSGLVTDGPTVPTPPKSVTPEEDEYIEETYTDPDLAEYTIMALVLMPKYQKMLKALLFNKEKLQELANTPLNENCSAVIHKKLPKKLRDPRKFLISCGFNELKCKALADLGASINLMPLSVWKKLGLPDLIPTRMTLELANRVICTPDGIARDVFVLVGKFIFLVDFVVVDYESDPRVPLILRRPFLRTARALIDVHDIDSFNDIHPYFDDNPLSGSTTFSSNSLLEEFIDELALITYPSDYDDNLKFDIKSDLREIESLLYQGEDSGIKDSIDQTDLANLDDYFVDPTPKMFTDEHAPDYSFPLIFDVYDDDFLEIESYADNFYDDPFDSKGEKIKESKLLIDELDLPYDFLPYSEYDSFNSQDFSRDDDLPSPNNEDKVFNPRILIQEKSITIITRVAQVKKLAISYASLVFEDFDPLLYEPFVFKDVPKSIRLLLFSSENKEKVFKPGIYTSEKVHSYFLPELSYPGYYVFKVDQIFISLMKIFHVQCGKNTPLLDVLLFHFYPP